MSETIVAYKGFDKDLKCHDGFQYEIGKEYEQDSAEVCDHGFHACEMPLHVFNHFAPGDGSRYCVVEQSGEISRKQELDDSKQASSKIKIGAEIGIPGLVKAQIEYVKARCTNGCNAEPGKPATAGDSGAATSRGRVTVGKNGVGTVRGNNVKIRGGMGAFLSIAEENAYNYNIGHWKTFVIDGKTYKPNTWYALKDGQIVEVTE